MFCCKSAGYCCKLWQCLVLVCVCFDGVQWQYLYIEMVSEGQQMYWNFWRPNRSSIGQVVWVLLSEMNIPLYNGTQVQGRFAPNQFRWSSSCLIRVQCGRKTYRFWLARSEESFYATCALIGLRQTSLNWFLHTLPISRNVTMLPFCLFVNEPC